MFTDTRRIARKPSRRQWAAVDRQIEAIVRRRCSGMAINVLDIGQVFDAGRAAAEGGQDIETAVVGKYAELSAAAGRS